MRTAIYARMSTKDQSCDFSCAICERISLPVALLWNMLTLDFPEPKILGPHSTISLLLRENGSLAQRGLAL
jgi:hypothetical protein